MRRFLLSIGAVFILVSCSNAGGNAVEINPPSVQADPSTASPYFSAKDKDELSALDFNAAYAMCVTALAEYYKAVWNGSSMNGDTYFTNENLRRYMQKKITFLYDLHHRNSGSLNTVAALDTGVIKAELDSKGNNAFFYFKLTAHVKQDTGSFSEPTEFLVQNLDGQLIIADWYTGTKDSYDFLMRGERQIINNPAIWDDSKWAGKLLDSKETFTPMR